MKNKILIFVILVLTVSLFTGCDEELVDITPKELDEAISLAFLNDNQNRYSDGECKGEGHIILGQEKKEDRIIVYALTMYGEYGFEDGNFVKVSGSGIIPTVFTFKDSDEGLISIKVEYPEDGSRYTKSIKRLFPNQYRDRVIFTESDRDDLKFQERLYAENYLKKIGRDAIIGDYSDFEHLLLTDVGVSVQVSNKTCDKEYANYPMWIGNREVLEDGNRYVYEMSYDKEIQEIIYKKYEYDSKEIIEIIRLDSITGLEIK